MARAMATPIQPEIRNRGAKENSGDASATIIRAEVKADDQMKAKTSPMAIARKSIGPPVVSLAMFPIFLWAASMPRQKSHTFWATGFPMAFLLIDWTIKDNGGQV